MQRGARILHRAATHIIEGNCALLHIGPKRRPLRREQLGAESRRVHHRDHRFAQLFIQRVTADRGLELDVHSIWVARLRQQFLGFLRIVIQLRFQIRIVAILAGAERAVETAGEAFEQRGNNLIAVDRLADRLSYFFFVEGRFRLHRQKHNFHRVDRRDA